MKRSLALALLFASAAAASPLTLRVTLPAGTTVPAGARVVLRRADGAATPVEHRLSGGASAVDLEDGAWQLDVDAAGLWHERQYVTVAGATEADVRLWLASTLSGAIAGSAADRVTIRFATTGGPTGEVVCPVDTKRFTCALPAGTADLALRTPGCVTRYVWSVPLAPNGTRDLGRLDFQRGATLTGRVDPPRRAKLDLRTVTITASAANFDEQAERGRTFTSMTARPNAKGFFHLDGIAPGEYKIVAATARPRLSSPPLNVTVIEGAEASLARPLALSAPRPLTVSIDPPLDPWLKQWRIELAVQRTPQYYEPLADALVAPNGTYRSEPLHAGRYDLRISGQDSSVWHRAEIDVDDATESLFIPLRVAPVHGTVRLGEKPLAATIWFGGQHNLPSLEMHSDDSGEFRGFLPQRDSDVWPVTVQSETPMAKRNFPAVKLRARDDGSLEADLRLDLTMLQGDVVEANGAPPSETVMLNISSKEGEFIQPRTTEDGRFAVYGLAPGSYEVVASAYLRESKPVDVEVRPGGEPPMIRLVLLANRELKGLVKSAFGPVAGAKIIASSTDVPTSVVPIFDTDERGMFTAILPPGAEQLDVVVEPPGFALKFFHVKWEKRQLVVPVTQSGGTLTINGIDPSVALIRHAGATVRLHTLRTWFAASSTGDRTSIAMLEPGMYSVCPLDNRSACASGFLPAAGALELEMRRNNTKEARAVTAR
jgi:hypothetical protein